MNMIGLQGGYTPDQNFYDKKFPQIKAKISEIGEVNPKNKEELKEKVDKANKIMTQESTHLKFEIHEKTHAVMVKIIESETGEVLREIPPEKLIDMLSKICELAGLFVNKKI